MVINNNIQAVAGAYNVSSTTSTRHVNEVEQVSKTDEVQLSSSVQSFSSILQKLQGLDETRMDKVESISQQMAAGTYQIDAQKVADSMLNTRF